MNILNICDNAICSRGYNYYKKGQVKSVNKINDNLYNAVVSGSDEYNVQIDLTNVKKCKCSCRYKDGICKHIIKTIFEILPNEVYLY